MSTARKAKIKVYSGLTLNEQAIKAILPNAVVSSPIGRGDLPGDIKESFNVVVILDGKFYYKGPRVEFAVAPSEILDALRSGIVVYGASSMGALRAVELEAYGMKGYGRIFEHVRACTPAFDDALLAHLYVDHPSKRLQSLPYIDFYFNLSELREKGECDRATFNSLTRAYRDLHYSSRNLAELERRVGKVEVARRAYLSMGSQKRRDALGVLRLVRKRLREVELLNGKLRRNQT